jgi:hypothetical protein
MSNYILVYEWIIDQWLGELKVEDAGVVGRPCLHPWAPQLREEGVLHPLGGWPRHLQLRQAQRLRPHHRRWRSL